MVITIIGTQTYLLF